MSAPAPLTVVAVVSVNNDEALVLNRPLRMVYERVGNDYIGSDGPFRNLLYYERGGGRFVAFAGRELSLTMKDGTVANVKDHWWSGLLEGHVGAVVGDVESLRKCYVLSGGYCIAPDDLAALRATYTGCVYPYRDYEKVITFDQFRKEMWGKVFHLERRCKALVAEVKAKHRELQSLRSTS